MEDFIDWIAEIDKFFDCMKVLVEKRVKLVGCGLKGGVPLPSGKGYKIGGFVRVSSR